MKIKWLMQTSGFNTKTVLEQYETLNRLGYEVNDFGLIPFTNTITNLDVILEPDTKFIIKGGTKILMILEDISHLSESSDSLNEEQKKNSDSYIEALKKGIDYNLKSFDQFEYKDYDLPLLNNDAEYLFVSEILERSFEKDMFIKPSRDLKAFNGGIIKAGETVQSFIDKNYPQPFYKNEQVVLNNLQDIYYEYRFFVIDKEVITASLYKRGSTIIYDSMIPDYIMNKAKEYAKLYQPADIFAMDLAETPQGVKIIEYNCWNASGLYHVDVQKLFHLVNEFKKYKD